MKKNKKKLYKSNNFDNSSYTKMIWIGLGVILVLGLVYFFTALGTGEIKLGKKEKKEKEETKIQYQEILGGEVFNRSTTDYYVLFYKPSDVYANYYLSLISSYSYKANSLPFYLVDLENTLNKEYAIAEDDETEYKRPSNIENLKVTNPSILRIRNKQVFDYISGQDNVIKFFNN